MHWNAINAWKCQNEPRKIPKIDTTLVLFYVDMRNILKVRRGNKYRLSPKVAHSLSKPSGLLWEKLQFMRSLYPNFASNAKIFLPRHVDAVPWYHVKFHEFQLSFQFTRTMYLNASGWAAMSRCLTFILISCMGLKHVTKDTHFNFEPIYMHWSMCM